MAALPRVLVMNTLGGYTVWYRKKEGEDEGGFVWIAAGKNSVFDPMAKIEVEQAKINKNYVHIRFCYSNRYWQKATKGEDLYRLVAESKQPIEDTSDPSCTLFEPFSGSSSDVFYLKHVQTGRLVLFKGNSVLADENANATPNESDNYFSVVDCETLVQLPEHFALKGDNGKYLKAYQLDGDGDVKYWQLQYGETDPNKLLSGHTVQQDFDGHVRILSDYFGRYWRLDQYNNNNSWIFADSSDNISYDSNGLFWPVKIDGSIIALRSKSSGMFCSRHTADGKTDFLAAIGNTMSAFTKMQVEELTLERKIYYVDIRRAAVPCGDRPPHQVINATDDQTSESVTITYQDEKSYTFSRGFSVTAGVKTSIKAGVPFIADGKIEVSFEISGNFQWSTTTTTTTSVSATGTINVPPRSSVIVEYVGTRGTCNIPYSYTQLDRSATDGKVKRTEMTDGTYTGVSCYNFSFKMSAPKSTI